MLGLVAAAVVVRTALWGAGGLVGLVNLLGRMAWVVVTAGIAAVVVPGIRRLRVNGALDDLECRRRRRPRLCRRTSEASARPEHLVVRCRHLGVSQELGLPDDAVTPAVQSPGWLWECLLSFRPIPVNPTVRMEHWE